MLLRQESVTTQIPQGKEFSHQPIIHLRPEEQQPVVSMGHIVSAEIDGEPVLTMAAWHSGYTSLFPIQKTYNENNRPTMIITIISLVAAILLVLYVSKNHDYKILERNNKWLKEQREQAPKPMPVDDVNNHPLDKESAMAAIRYNGYVPEANDHWITFMAQGEHYAIDADRFPVMVMIKHYNLDHKEWDMDLMHKAAHQVSDDIIMGKVLFTGEEEDGIMFQITAIENKYGHFKDCLTRYINIIEESQSRMGQLYKEMEAERKDAISAYPRLEMANPKEKKVMS